MNIFTKIIFLDNNEFNTHYIVLLFLLRFEDLESTNNKINLEEQHHEHLWLDNKRDIKIIENMNTLYEGLFEKTRNKKIN